MRNIDHLIGGGAFADRIATYGTLAGGELLARVEDPDDVAV